MKKTLLIIALAIAIVSCDKKESPATAAKEMKTAYVDTSKLLEEYTEAKDIESKYKSKSEAMGKELQSEINRFKADASNFQKNAQANGQAWAQENGAKLQRREQELSYAQDAMLQQIRQESGAEMDSLVSKVKKYVKDYGKKEGYSYIFSTGEAVSILYAEEKYDITKTIVKELNEKYASEGKKGDKDNKDDLAAEAKAELKDIEKKKK